MTTTEPSAAWKREENAYQTGFRAGLWFGAICGTALAIAIGALASALVRLLTP